MQTFQLEFMEFFPKTKDSVVTEMSMRPAKPPSFVRMQESVALSMVFQNNCWMLSFLNGKSSLNTGIFKYTIFSEVKFFLYKLVHEILEISKWKDDTYNHNSKRLCYYRIQLTQRHSQWLNYLTLSLLWESQMASFARFSTAVHRSLRKLR